MSRSLRNYYPTTTDSQNSSIFLRNAGVEALKDQPVQGTFEDLQVMDPMTFFGYIYKHGPLRNKRVLRSVCASLGVNIDVKDICGVPSQNAQKSRNYKGAEIHPSLYAPSDIKSLFPSLKNLLNRSDVKQIENDTQ